MDQAMLLVSVEGRGLALFAFLSQANHTFKLYKLDTIKDTSSLRAMGVASVRPGTYKTACGKGYWKCKKGEVPEMTIRLDAINYFKTESANSYFYWDAKAAFFKKVWISD